MRSINAWALIGSVIPALGCQPQEDHSPLLVDFMGPDGTELPQPVPATPPPAAGDPLACEGFLPATPSIADFSSWNETDGKWGDASLGELSGGSFTYGDIATDSLLNGTVDPTAENPALHLVGTVSTFAGYTLWFDSCTDASAFGGIGFTIAGSSSIEGGAVGEVAALELHLETNSNFPVDQDAMRGGCQFTNLLTRWDECVNTRATGLAPTTPSTLVFPWEAFSGGLPVAGAEPAQLLGLEWRFVCGTGETTCNIDVTIDDVAFFPAASASP